MRRHLFALFGGIALLATLIPAGSAAWMFSFDEASDKANVIVQGDPIRDNHVLGDDNDPDYAGQTFYDVYFAAQVTPLTGSTGHISDSQVGSQILGSDQSSFSTSNPCYGGVAAEQTDPRLGHFEVEGETSPSYYRFFEKKTSITHSELEDINASFVSKVVDRTPWPLSLVGWTPMLVCNFALGPHFSKHLHWPELETIKKNVVNVKTEEGEEIEYLQVDGYYPNDGSLLLFSANTLLEKYQDYAARDIDGNGRKDLILYPILSSGKNNHAYDAGETVTDALAVNLIPGPGKDSDGNSYDMGGQGPNATYDPMLSREVMKNVTSGTRVEVFRYENVVFQEGSGSSLGFALDPNRSMGNGYDDVDYAGWPGVDNKGRWDGDAQVQTNHDGTTVNYDETNRFYITEADSIANAAPNSITGLSGRYNIYFVDLINDDQQLKETSEGGWLSPNWPSTFTAENELTGTKSALVDVFSSYGITAYQVVIIDHVKLVTVPREERGSPHLYGYDWTFYAQTRALAIVLERVYEPRLILGDTGSMDFANGRGMTQVAGPTQHTYTLTNVNLDGETSYTLTTSNGNIPMTNDIFAVMLANQADFTTYQMKPGNGPGPAGEGYNYSDFSGEYFEKYFVTTEEDKQYTLAKAKDDFKGSYDLLVTVEMKWDETGTWNTPSTVTIYGRRRAAYYVNVCVDPDIDIGNAPTHGEEDGSMAGFVDTSVYDYRFEAFQESEALTPETSFVSKDGTSAKAFADILKEVYRSTGSYLQDITTGRIFTPMEFYVGSGATYEPQGSMALYLWKPGS